MVNSAVPTQPALVVDVERAPAIWRKYCEQHDTTVRHGQTAGIEPASGRIWFGESATDVYRQKVADGMDAPIYVVRVGYDHYLWKGLSQGMEEGFC
jgi:hypothetical protein